MFNFNIFNYILNQIFFYFKLIELIYLYRYARTIKLRRYKIFSKLTFT